MTAAEADEQVIDTDAAADVFVEPRTAELLDDQLLDADLRPDGAINFTLHARASTDGNTPPAERPPRRDLRRSRSGYARDVARVEHRHDATPFLPERMSLKSLREAAAGCRGCHLYAGATQTVFGEGLKRAKLMLVGEMPGDREDRAGRVFVGPAGRELDKALERVAIVRADVYITNVVKHFKFEERGKRRIHQTPKKAEVDACFPWLRAELSVVRPEAVVVLGATAGKALLGSSFRLTESRGHPIESDIAPFVTATVHPSAILRAPDDEARHAERSAFTSDLQAVADFLAG